MNMKKFFSLTLAAALSLSVLAGCGQKPATNEEETKEATKTEEKTEATTATGDVLKFATNAAFPPYEFKVGEEFKGIDVEIADAIAKELGKKAEIVDMEFDSIIPSVDKGECDLAIAGMTVTEERKQTVDFTSSYATGIQSIIVKEDSAIKSVDDLKGKKIGVQLGTTGDIYSTDDFGEEMVTKYSKGADAVIALKGGDIDAVIIDNQPALSFVKENEGIKLVDSEYAMEDYAIGVKKGNTELLDSVNEALKTLTKDGTIDKIIAKYIVAE